MKRYQVKIKPTAEKDLVRRYQQIAEDSPQNAITWYLSLIESVEKLEIMAERCPIAPEDTEIQKGIRHLIVGSYRVLYYVDGCEVKILHVRHNAHARVL